MSNASPCYRTDSSRDDLQCSRWIRDRQIVLQGLLLMLLSIRLMLVSAPLPAQVSHKPQTPLPGTIRSSPAEEPVGMARSDSKEQTALKGLTLFYSPQQRWSVAQQPVRDEPMQDDANKAMATMQQTVSQEAETSSVPRRRPVPPVESQQVQSSPSVVFTALLESEGAIRVLLNNIPCRAVVLPIMREQGCPRSFANHGGHGGLGSNMNYALACPHLSDLAGKLCLDADQQTVIFVESSTSFVRIRLGEAH